MGNNRQPSYLLADFVKACAVGKSKAFVVREAKLTAKSDFNLHTEEAILDFIGQGGMESLQFISSKNWEKNPHPSVPVKVDAYNFYSGLRFGYLAFFHGPVTDKWIIKSFKGNDQPGPKNLSIANQLGPIRKKLYGGGND